MSTTDDANSRMGDAAKRATSIVGKIRLRWWFAIAPLVALVLLPTVTIVRVPPGQIGIVYSRVGDDLPTGQILAKQGEKGVREDFLTPGWHLVNPLWISVDLEPDIAIPAGKVGVQTSLARTIHETDGCSLAL